MLSKLILKKLDRNYAKMLRAILKKIFKKPHKTAAVLLFPPSHKISK